MRAVPYFSMPAGTIRAFDANGTVVATVGISGPQNVASAWSLTAPQIVRVEIECPQDEHLLVELCVDAS